MNPNTRAFQRRPLMKETRTAAYGVETTSFNRKVAITRAEEGKGGKKKFDEL